MKKIILDFFQATHHSLFDASQKMFTQITKHRLCGSRSLLCKLTSRRLVDLKIEL
ncbi:MAG TPA: hypothetical protein VHS05_20740 [Pyrinomonadaceae bacterium]|jgi:hypothetical protein|nr:hypothetical protein [Pyrinomonadaceae bacterium]